MKSLTTFKAAFYKKRKKYNYDRKYFYFSGVSSARLIFDKDVQLKEIKLASQLHLTFQNFTPKSIVSYVGSISIYFLVKLK